jgi:hypothetical protein
MERPISSVRNGSSSRLLLPSTGKLSPPVPGAYSPSCVCFGLCTRPSLFPTPATTC